MLRIQFTFGCRIGVFDYKLTFRKRLVALGQEQQTIDSLIGVVVSNASASGARRNSSECGRQDGGGF